MAITALSSVQPLPQLTALQAKQITESTPVETTRKPNNVAAYATATGTVNMLNSGVTTVPAAAAAATSASAVASGSSVGSSVSITV